MRWLQSTRRWTQILCTASDYLTSSSKGRDLRGNFLERYPAHLLMLASSTFLKIQHLDSFRQWRLSTQWMNHLLLGRKHLAITPLAISNHRIPALKFLTFRVVRSQSSQFSSCCCHGSCRPLTKRFNRRCDGSNTVHSALFSRGRIFFSSCVLKQFRIHMLGRDLDVPDYTATNKTTLQGD